MIIMWNTLPITGSLNITKKNEKKKTGKHLKWKWQLKRGSVIEYEIEQINKTNRQMYVLFKSLPGASTDGERRNTKEQMRTRGKHDKEEEWVREGDGRLQRKKRHDTMNDARHGRESETEREKKRARWIIPTSNCPAFKLKSIQWHYAEMYTALVSMSVCQSIWPAPVRNRGRPARKIYVHGDLIADRSGYNFAQSRGK